MANCDTEKLTFNVITNSRKCKNSIKKIAKELDICILIHDFKKINFNLFKKLGIVDNYMISSVLVPFYSNHKFSIYFDNDTIILKDIIKRIRSLIENDNKAAVRRRSWNIEENNPAFKFAKRKYLDNHSDIISFKKSIGNGGLILFNNEIYKKFFDNDIFKLYDSLELFIANKYDNINSRRNKFKKIRLYLDDELFLSCVLHTVCSSDIPLSLNFTINYIDEYKKREIHLFHLANIQNDIKLQFYDYIISELGLEKINHFNLDATKIKDFFNTNSKKNI